MSAAVSGVPAEAAARAMYDPVRDRMHFPTDWDGAPEPLRQSYRDMAAAALPALREQIGAEVLEEIALGIEWEARKYLNSPMARHGFRESARVARTAILSVPEQAAERTTRHGHPIGDESLGQCTAKHFAFGRCHLVPHPAGTGHSIEHPFDSGHWIGFDDEQVAAHAAEEVDGK